MEGKDGVSIKNISILTKPIPDINVGIRVACSQFNIFICIVEFCFFEVKLNAGMSKNLSFPRKCL